MAALSRRRHRDESGGVAVFTAVLAVLLLALAAISVDLGNAWARGRIVQKQADVTALSLGHLLPMTSTNVGAISAEAASYLNRNLAQGQAAVTASQLRNGTLADGELVFQNSDGSVCITGCTRVTLHPPEAQVDFGFAKVLGFTETTVQRPATVQVGSELPSMEKVLPLWLPSGCGYGAVQGDTSGGGNGGGGNGNGNNAAAFGVEGDGLVQTFGVSLTPTANHRIVSALDPVVVAVNERREIRGLTISNVPNNSDKVALRFVRPDGSGYVETAVADAAKTNPLAVPPFEVGPSGSPLATSITDVPGEWRIYAMVKPNGNGKEYAYSQNFVVLRVGSGGQSPDPDPGPNPDPGPGPNPGPIDPAPGEPSLPVGCVGQDRGNFGQLDSPRKDAKGTKDVMAKNMALGLDHRLLPWDHDPGTDTCAHTNGNNPLPGSQLDDQSRDGNNCIKAEPGNAGPGMFDGLIAGVGGHPGRIAAGGGATLCPGRPSVQVKGTTINNDVLSCFLRPGYSLAHIATDTGASPEMLDPRVKESPRFVWLPLVRATDRSEKGYQPMIDFAPAFITDEAVGQPATSENGLSINGNSIKTIQVFVFSKDALPVDESSPVTDYNPVLGRAKVSLVG